MLITTIKEMFQKEIMKKTKKWYKYYYLIQCFFLNLGINKKPGAGGSWL
jgi:hypothetical protein